MMHLSDPDTAAPPPSDPPAPAAHYDTSRHAEWAGAVEGMVRAAVSQLNLGSDECPAVELIDAAILDAQISSLKAAFPDNWLHAYAIKANPLKGVLARVRAAGLGAECASREELLHARRCGFPARALVYDSPCKTRADLRAALSAGALVNLDSASEVAALADVLAAEAARGGDDGGSSSGGGGGGGGGRSCCAGDGCRGADGGGGGSAAPARTQCSCGSSAAGSSAGGGSDGGGDSAAGGSSGRSHLCDGGGHCRTCAVARVDTLGGADGGAGNDGTSSSAHACAGGGGGGSSAGCASGTCGAGGGDARGWRAGLRINPLVGEGTIGHTSTATAASKFGEALEPARIDALVGLYRRHAWLTCVHCHVGSQGCSGAMLVAGARAAVDFARRVNAAVARRQVFVIDIGGGLCTNYRSNEPAMAGMSFADYAASLRATVPELFTGEFEVITEFGRSIVAKAGVTLSCVAGLKSCGGVPTAILHTGANQFVRQAYRPAEWFQRLSVFGRDGAVRQCSAARPMVPHNVAGPLCFSGDLLARALPLPQVAAGDVICIHDTGAYCTSMYSMYNSRTPLPVYLVARSAPPQPGARLEYCFTPIKVQSTAQTLAFWE